MTDFTKNPFPGLRSFEIKDAQYFFGREKQIDEVVEKLNEFKFTAVLGPAGSGKSSLIKAGVIPEILSDSKLINWDYSIFSPENNPLENFYNSIQNLAAKYIEEFEHEDFERKIVENQNYIHTVINQISDISNKNILIYIDQFEDIFFYSDKSEKNTLNSQLFIKNLIEIVENKNNNFYVLTSLKSDYLSYSRDFEGLVEIINIGHYLIPKLSHKQKVEAITKPFELSNLRVSKDLVEKISKDLEIQENQLLILQHTMMRTWDYHRKNFPESNTIEIEHYYAIGGADNSINNHADEIFQNLESEKNKNLAEKIFKSLILVKNDNTISRNSVLLSDICDISGGKTSDVVKILDTFRLNNIAFIQPTINEELNEESIVRISRDIIIEKWNTFVTWIEEEKKSVQIYKSISLTAGLYQEGKAKHLVNPELQQGLNWLKINNPNVYWAKQYDPYFERAVNFIHYSKKEYEAEIEANEKKQQRDVKRFRNFAIILGVASLVSILFLLFALSLSYEAQNSEKQARINEKKALEEKLIAADREKDAVTSQKIAEQQKLIAEQQKLIANRERENALIQKDSARKSEKRAKIAEEIAINLRDSAIFLKEKAEDNESIAVVNANIAQVNESIAVFQRLRAEDLRKISIAKSLAANAVKIKKISGKKIDTLSRNLAILSYLFMQNVDVDTVDADIFTALSVTGNNVKEFKISQNHIDAVRDIKVFSNGKNFVTCSDDGTAKIWNTENYTNENYVQDLKIDNNQKNNLRCLDISPDEDKIVSGSTKGEIFIWKDINISSIFNNKTSINAEEQSIHTGIVNDILFINNDTLLTISDDKKITRISLSVNFKVDTLKKFDSEPVCFSESLDGKYVAVGLQTGDIFIYDKEEFKRSDNNISQYIIIPTKEKITAMTFVKGNKIAVGNSSNEVKIFEIETTNLYKTITDHSSGINKLAYNKKLELLASGSYDGTIKIWDVNNYDKDPFDIDDYSFWIYSICFSENGELLFVASADRTMPVTFLNVNYKTLFQKLTENYNLIIDDKDWEKYVAKDINKDSFLNKN